MTSASRSNPPEPLHSVTVSSMISGVSTSTHDKDKTSEG